MFSKVSLGAKLSIGYSVLILLAAWLLVTGLYWQLHLTQRQAVRERLDDIIHFAAPEVDGDFHSLVRDRGSENSEFYHFIAYRLLQIKQNSKAIRQIYTLRQMPDGSIIYVVYPDPPNTIHVGDLYQNHPPG